MLTTLEKVLFLKSIDLFSEIPAQDLADVALIASEESVDAGDQVFAEGEVGDALYLLVEGRVRVQHGERVIAELGERECFGEMAILDAAPRSASVWALTDAWLLKISRDDFQALLADKPAVGRGVIRVLTRRLRQASR